MASSVIPMDRDTVVINASLVPTTTDGRYYSCGFALTGDAVRETAILAYSNQTATVSGIIPIVLMKDGTVQSADSRVSNPSSGRLQVDSGSSAWNRPLLIHNGDVTITA